jgi:ubiquinone/menaquinone biosynthesis C-methylase UbiE
MGNGFTRGNGLLENFFAKKRAEQAKRIIPVDYFNGTILDVGCGTIPYFLNKTKFKKKIGIDYNIENRVFKDTVLKKINIEKQELPFEENSFDVVTMLAVLEHLEPKKATASLKEVYRVLKPNGYFVLTTPSRLANYLMKLLARIGLLSKEEIDEHKKLYSHKEISNLLMTVGFKKERIVLGQFEFFLNNYAIAKKK